jgi:hypothetical protein
VGGRRIVPRGGPEGDRVTEFAAQFFREFVAILREASPYILVGFAIAACV